MSNAQGFGVGPDPLRAFGEALAAAKAVENSSAQIAQTALQLYETAHAAREAGFASEVDEALSSAREETPEHARHMVTSAWLQENDREFRNHRVDGLSIRRVEFTGGSLTAEDLQIACTATSDGSFIPKAQRPGERTLLTIATAIQLFVPNDPSTERATELDGRGFDFSGLERELNTLYGLRTIRRAAWGSGFCVLTDQRAVGLIIDDEVRGVERSPERAAMPFAIVEGDGSGSVVLFAVERGLFETCQISTGLLQNRIPSVNISGICSLALQTYRLVDHSNRLVRPPKNTIGDGVKAFLAT